MSTTMTQTAVEPPAPVLIPAVNLDAYDDEQVRLMEERCILINEKDEAYGEGSKKNCEAVANAGLDAFNQNRPQDMNEIAAQHMKMFSELRPPTTSTHCLGSKTFQAPCLQVLWG